MPHGKDKGGRPAKAWKSLQDRHDQVAELASHGYTQIQAAKIMGVSRNTLGDYWRLNGIERNTDQVNHTNENSAPENLEVLDQLDKKFRAGIYRRYRLFDDPDIDDAPRCKHKPKVSPNRAGIHASDISSQLNLAKLEALRTFDPRHGSGAAFHTYAYKVFFNAMRQLEREAAKEARKRNQNGVDLSGDEPVGMGIEDTIIMDEDGEIVRIDSNHVKAGFAQARKQLQREASHDFVWDARRKEYHRSPRLRDSRVLFCFQCRSHYVPRWLHKAVVLHGNLYACPVCSGVDVTNTKMTEARFSLDGLSAKEMESRRVWGRFLVNTYNNVEGFTSTSQLNTLGTVPDSNHSIRQMEGEKHDATGEVRAGEVGMARRVRRQGPVYCARKLLRSFAEPDHTSIERIRKLPYAPGEQVQPVPDGAAS